MVTTHQVLEVARAGVAAGCTEALFTLGDKPELLYSQAKHEVIMLSHFCTTDNQRAGSFSSLHVIKDFMQYKIMHRCECFLDQNSSSETDV